MLFDEVLQRFLDQSPFTVMVRGTLENLLSPEKLDALFEEVAERQYTRDLLFSSLVDLMGLVVSKTRRSVRTAYLAREDQIPVSLKCVYDKLNHTEPALMRALVQRIGSDAAEILQQMGCPNDEWIEGLNVRVLDGNKLTGTQHRLEVLRDTKQAALPGQSLAVLDPVRRLVLDVVPCEDAHTQERALINEVLPQMAQDDLWIADRNFCTSKFILGVAKRLGFFIVRQHGGSFGFRTVGEERFVGRCNTGNVYEQTITVCLNGIPWKLRRVRVALDEPTQEGDTEIYLLTNLACDKADGILVAECYRRRWSIEGVFQILTQSFRCEVNTLGYPKAALFGFCMALVAFNALSLAQSALQVAHGSKASPENLSEDLLLQEVAAVHEGMKIAIPSALWERVQKLSPGQFSLQLVQWATAMDLTNFKKHRRGPKKPRPPRKSGDGNTHVSTARLLAERAAQTTRSP